jgi:hypothetical protein
MYKTHDNVKPRNSTLPLSEHTSADNKRYMQRTYNVTLRRVRITNVAVEKQYYILRVCARVRACVRAPYIAICGQSGSIILFHVIS